MEITPQRSKTMHCFALKTNISSYLTSRLNAIVFSSKTHVLTHNIDLSLPHTTYRYYFNKVEKFGKIELFSQKEMKWIPIGFKMLP